VSHFLERLKFFDRVLLLRRLLNERVRAASRWADIGSSAG